MANIINRQQTFSTNGTVTAAGLHNLIDTALVNSAIIKNQQEITTIGTADLLLIAPDSVDASLAPRKVTVQNLLDDGLTAGTFVSLNLTGALTYGTATGNRTVSTSATITTGTIPNLTAGTTTSTAATITTGTIPTLTAGTTTGTAGIFTSGTVATLNSTTGTITNLSTTLAGDFTISQGTGTLGTTGATLGTYGGSSSVPSLVIDTKGRVTTASTSALSFATGSSAAPSITTTSDTDTGIFFPAANTLGFTTQGTEVARFEATGDFSFNSGFGSAGIAYGCRAWVNFQGTGTVAIRASGNVSSITDNNVGNYTVNFTTAMPDANYAAASMAGQYGGGISATLGFDFDNNVRTTSAYRFYSVIPDSSASLVDIANVTMAFFR